MSAATRFVMLLITLSVPLDPVHAQAPLGTAPGIGRLAPAPHQPAPPEGGIEELDADSCCRAPVGPRETPGRGTALFSATATGIFFGAIVGGIYGSRQESCTDCDFWGAVSGGILGGLVGLAAGIAISIW